MKSLEKQKILDRHTFWKNLDWDWYKKNIPFFDCPDLNIEEMYYYRWELVTRHLHYASVEAGYVFTEFNSLEQVAWAGLYNTIVCAADLHVRECRWLLDPRYTNDYCRFWFENDGAMRFNYGSSLVDMVMSEYLVGFDKSLISHLLEPLIDYYDNWKKGTVNYPHDNGYDPDMGLFWNTGRDTAGEFNLASCQLNEELRGIVGYKIRGGAGYRADVNSYRYADVKGIQTFASILGNAEVSKKYAKEAEELKETILRKLWDPDRNFFIHRWKYDEYSEGDTIGNPTIRSESFLWQTNRDRHGGVGFNPDEEGIGKGRELAVGYFPWIYNIPDDNAPDCPKKDYSKAWEFLMDPEYFYGEYGPTTAERHDPWFKVIYGECRWNGGSWPFATCKVLEAAANLITSYKHQRYFAKKEYLELLKNYALTQYKDGRPYVAESHDPDTDRWTVDREAGSHYFHSTYVDNIITGLVGIKPSTDDVLRIVPLIPEDWDYLALDGVRYHGHEISLFWDRDGGRYHNGAGFSVFVNGKLAANSRDIEEISIVVGAPPVLRAEPGLKNYAVNNDGTQFPLAVASHAPEGCDLSVVHNGSYWYDMAPVNRWVSKDSPNAVDWICIDLGSPRCLQMICVYLYEDEGVSVPDEIRPEYWNGTDYVGFSNLTGDPEAPKPNCCNRFVFDETVTSKIRVNVGHKSNCISSVIEIEAWGI